MASNPTTYLESNAVFDFVRNAASRLGRRKHLSFRIVPANPRAPTRNAGASFTIVSQTIADLPQRG